MLAAERFEAAFQHAAQGLLDQVAGDEGRGIDGAFLLAAAADPPGFGRRIARLRAGSHDRGRDAFHRVPILPR